MALFLSIFLALQAVGYGFSGFTLSIASGENISYKNPACPLDLDVLRNLILDSTQRPTFLDVPSQCRYIFEGMCLIRSEYLRTNGYFLLPSNASKACWASYRILVSQWVRDFDIRSACGYHSNWISQGCMNIRSRSDFEILVPESAMREIRLYCNDSLEDSSHCALCKNTLSSIAASYFRGPSMGNESDCALYPFMYAAALVNRFGPADRATAKCLFSLEFLLPPRSSSVLRHRIVVCLVLIGCAIVFLGVFVAVWFLWAVHKEWEGRKRSLAKVGAGLFSRLRSIRGSTSSIRIKYEEIKQATHNFSRKNIIGIGRYGNVYKGILPDGSEVAIKRFKNCSAFGDATFANEVEVIASVKHVNLLALRGYCTAAIPVEGHQRIIVCDLMPNGSLSDHLFGPGLKKFSWPIRQNIALGTARGLSYLHYGVQPAVIHRDVKASNILLDENFEPKLADFGLAKITPEGMTHLSTRVAGTLGYVAPEYALYGQLTEKSDVYSFGVVLLELLSGKKALILTNEGQTSLLTDWAWWLVKEGRTLDVIEEGMPEKGLPEVMEQYVLIAVLCSHPLLEARPTMDQIVRMLEADLAFHSLPPVTEKIDEIA